ncbi:hypothetical protein [Bdellovibrio sp. HCB337]|uniref:hypothetical protein n=1 Tax=Bdellovibrio sp. HCB337 TaxID=3394358 RepID=UPI0039A62FBA
MKFIVLPLLVLSVTSAFVSPAHGQVKPNISAGEPTAMESRARKLYERITGTKLPVDSPIIAQMADMIGKGNLLGAAQEATKDPNFYNITVKLMAMELSTRDETIKTPFNDFAAGIIGVTRDQTDARELLTGNFYYQGSGTNIRSNLIPDLLISNNHYADLETNRVDLAANLVRVEGQVIATSATASVASPDPAGVLTSRTFMGEHALMGTNRRLVEYTFREFMCVPLSEWADGGASDARIGRDIDRFPAGDHMKFQTSCKGCHTVMDGFRGAFAKWDYDGMGIKHSAVNTRGGAANYTIASDAAGIVTKMNKNNTVFPSGYITTNDSFVNHATRTANAEMFEWRGAAAGGNGVKAFGTVVANSRRFSQCMAKRVFKAVCRKELDAVKNRDLLKKWGDEFETSGYKLKSLFESISTKPECLGS